MPESSAFFWVSNLLRCLQLTLSNVSREPAYEVSLLLCQPCLLLHLPYPRCGLIPTHLWHQYVHYYHLEQEPTRTHSLTSAFTYPL